MDNPGFPPADKPEELLHGVGIRLLHATDADALAEAYVRNRQHLAPWEPCRPEAFFTASLQRELIRAKREQLELGTEVPWVLIKDSGGLPAGQRIIGTVTLTGIVRGPFLSANLGYWVDHGLLGRGVGTAAVRFAAAYAQTELGLHRLQAATLLHNAASRRILGGAGFLEIGVAPEYLQIAGAWQDHLLHQLILPYGP
ncbi:GCN5-related N-acetyltransferase [Pseudarthrobacter chlorophenolicus A6]|uniref:GCN5-related N-acetyltransferase n=1 Tax=Pseudarthrobacter chlorophenolicus (strain ATCC 700700 / DSM 12829 / CIP 107037 / JCM 12360 / KCTC 9906 / NCIMB 13794 / A6) TaxID=452863 RepID=B8H6S1_PSECP|nr:GNAT family N-acetyltransferase [Pseudarthrobacter chlorophenolicus]ACL41597.1 GCN5-related N-acetyltransferase [Pseudarthrobacter chlorophenolicus A6]SDQ61482.1 [SSU ribosomal protein S5P]-alanine acetyltransferase [Pseudarthrobacter chlorophenolicus]